MNKKEDLYRLAQKRKNDKWGDFHSIGDFHGGIYDCDHVSPYTKSAGNQDADIFLMLQDWSSSNALSGAVCQDSVIYGHTVDKFTNKNLKELLCKNFNVKLSDTYGTNIFPFIKHGAMNARISRPWLKRAAEEYGMPQVRIVRPKLVICFGLATFNAMRSVSGRDRVGSVAKGIESPFEVDGISIWLQAHTGRLGQNSRNRGGVDRVQSDWQRMAGDYRARTQKGS